MQLKRCLSALLTLALALLSLAACAREQAPLSPETQESDAPIDTAPVAPAPSHDADAWIEERISACVRDDAALTWEATSDGVRITGYTGEAECLALPATIGSLSVVEIGAGAFADRATLRALSIPTSVMRVGTGILSGCFSLEVLSTPILGGGDEGYLGYLFGSTRFTDNARDVPPSLRGVRLLGMRSLPAHALYECNDLEYLSLVGMESVGDFSLARCESLVAIGGLDTVRTFGEYALSECRGLQSLTLGAATERIGFATLAGCDALRVLRLPFVGESTTKNSYLGYVFGAAYPDFAKGYYPPRLARVEVTGGEALGDYAFYECQSLKELSLPDGLLTVGVRALAGCSALHTLTLPDSVRTVRENAFADCDSLLSVSLGRSLSSLGINAFLYCDSLGEVVLPESLTALPASAFYGCSSLATVTLGGVTEVGARAFGGCASLREIKTNKTVTLAAGNEYAESILNP